MKIFNYIICLGFVIPAQAEVLALGEVLTLPTAPTGTIHVSSRRSIQVIDRGRTLEIWGKRLGTSMISQGSRAWMIQVVSVPTAATYRSFSAALEKMKGLELSLEDGNVVVRGHLLRIADWLALKRLHLKTGGKWLMRARIDPEIQPQMVLKEAGLISQHLYELEFDPSPRIRPKTPDLLKLAVAQSLTAMGLEILAPNAALTGKSIRLQVTIAEILNSASDRLGLRYEDGQSVQILPKIIGVKSLEAGLNFLAQNGEARILANPSLVTRPGNEAEFLAGGEFAVRTSSYRSKDVSWKRHGLWLRFRPDWRDGTQVAIKIETEFSHPDFSQMVDGIPSLRTHKTSTNTDLELGTSLLLANLVQSQSGNSNVGIKGLKNIPLLGALFGSKDFSEQRSELMVFVKPVLVEEVN